MPYERNEDMMSDENINAAASPQAASTQPQQPQPAPQATPQSACASQPTQPQGAPSAAPKMPPAPGAPAGQVPPAGHVPPAGQVPPQMPPQQSYGAPQAAPMPQNMPGMPLLYLTGGMKFGWAVVGLFMGPIAILLAWLVNAHNFPQAKSEAVKFSLIGFLAQFVLVFLIVVLFGFAACAAVSSIGSMAYYY